MANIPTAKKIRDFCILHEADALTTRELKAICYDYLNKVIREQGNFPRWPQEVKQILNSHGVMQCRDTGKPIIDTSLKNNWAQRALIAEDIQNNQQAYIEELESKLSNNQTIN